MEKRPQCFQGPHNILLLHLLHATPDMSSQPFLCLHFQIKIVPSNFPGPSYTLHTSRFLPHHLPQKVSHSTSSLLHHVKIFSMDTGLGRFWPLLIIPTSSQKCLSFGICTSWFLSLTCYFIPGPLATRATFKIWFQHPLKQLKTINTLP